MPRSVALTRRQRRRLGLGALGALLLTAMLLDAESAALSGTIYPKSLAFGLGFGFRLRKRRGGATGGGVIGAFTSMASGLNFAELYPYYAYQAPFVDLIHSQSIYMVGTGFNTTGTTTNASNQITAVASMTGATVGMTVTGPGVDFGTTIIAVAGTTITLSGNVTSGAGTGAVTFTFNGMVVPESARDADGWPNSVAGLPGITGFQMYLNHPINLESYSFAWQVGGTPGGNGASALTITPANPVGVGAIINLSAHNATLAPTTISQQQSTGQPVVTITWTLASDGSYVKYPTCRPIADPGGIWTDDFVTRVTSVIGDGPLRTMRSSTVEANGHPNGWVVDPAGNFTWTNMKFPVDGDGKLRDPILTSANRNTPTRHGEFWDRREGIPFEYYVLLANLIGTKRGFPCDLFFPVHNQSDATYRQAIASSAANGFDPANGWGPLVGDLYCERGNEPWNGGAPYTFHAQLVTEGLALGYGAGDGNIAAQQRYAEVALEMRNDMQPVFDAAGKSAKFKPVLAWQAAASPNILDAMIGWAGAGKFTTWSVAGYFGIDTAAYPITYAGDVALPIATMAAQMDIANANMLAHKAKAAEHGMDLVLYEDGPGVSFDTQAEVDAFHTNAGFGDVVRRHMNERRRIGICGNYFNMGVPWGTGDHEYGLWQHATDTIDATRPALLAVREAIAGTYTMFDPILGNVQVFGNTAAATEIGQFAGGLLPEAVISLIADGGGAYTVVRTTDANGAAIGSLRTVAGNPTAGAASVTLRQAFNGVNHDSVHNFTVLPALPKDNFNDNSLDPMWTVDLELAGGHGFSSTGVTVLEQNQRIELAGSVPNQNYLRTTNSIDLTQLPKHFIKIVQATGAGREVYPLTFGNLNTGAGGATLRPRLVPGDAHLFIDHYDAAGTWTNLSAIPSVVNLASPLWMRLRYDAGTDKFFYDFTTTANNPPVETDWVSAGSVSRPADIPTTGYLGFGIAPNTGVATTLYIDGFNEAT